MVEKKGQRNIYHCESCKHEIVTENMNDGVTPFMIGCRSCDGEMRSGMYPKSLDSKQYGHTYITTHYWRRNTEEEIVAFKEGCKGDPGKIANDDEVRNWMVNRACYDHAKNGGMMLINLDGTKYE